MFKTPAQILLEEENRKLREENYWLQTQLKQYESHKPICQKKLPTVFMPFEKQIQTVQRLAIGTLELDSSRMSYFIRAQTELGKKPYTISYWADQNALLSSVEPTAAIASILEALCHQIATDVKKMQGGGLNNGS